MITVISIYLVLYLQTVLITAGHGVTIMQVSKYMFIVNIIFYLLKANTLRLKNITCNSNEPKQCTSTGQITEVSNSMKQGTAEIMQTYDLLKFAIA